MKRKSFPKMFIEFNCFFNHSWHVRVEIITTDAAGLGEPQSAASVLTASKRQAFRTAEPVRACCVAPLIFPAQEVLPKSSKHLLMQNCIK